MAIVRTQRPELFRRVVLDRPPILAPIAPTRDELVAATPESPASPRAERPTLSYVARVLARRSIAD